MHEAIGQDVAITFVPYGFATVGSGWGKLESARIEEELFIYFHRTPSVRYKTLSGKLDRACEMSSGFPKLFSELRAAAF